MIALCVTSPTARSEESWVSDLGNIEAYLNYKTKYENSVFIKAVDRRLELSINEEKGKIYWKNNRVITAQHSKNYSKISLLYCMS